MNTVELRTQQRVKVGSYGTRLRPLEDHWRLLEWGWVKVQEDDKRVEYFHPERPLFDLYFEKNRGIYVGGVHSVIGYSAPEKVHNVAVRATTARGNNT